MKTLFVSGHIMTMVMKGGHELIMNVETNIHDDMGNNPAYVYHADQFNNGIKPYNTTYTDRLFQEDHEKYNMLCKKHFGNEGQMWGSRDPKKIEAFLSDFLGYPVQLCRVKQYEHKINGNYYWRLDYNKIP